MKNILITFITVLFLLSCEHEDQQIVAPTVQPKVVNKPVYTPWVEGFIEPGLRSRIRLESQKLEQKDYPILASFIIENTTDNPITFKTYKPFPMHHKGTKIISPDGKPYSLPFGCLKKHRYVEITISGGEVKEYTSHILVDCGSKVRSDLPENTQLPIGVYKLYYHGKGPIKFEIK